MNIGIGVTTYNRPKHLELFYQQIKKYKPNNVQIHCALDEIKNPINRRGVAYRKNECLRSLKDCDYIFLFDDDCFPIKEGWVNYFINEAINSRQSHFLYLKETPSIKKIKTENEINSFDNCGGCFMFLTKEAIEKIGGFNEAYGLYGFEHANYSNRIHAAGLTPMGAYLCPSGASNYIYAMDYDNYLPFNKEVNHKPSIGLMEAQESIKKNLEIYKNDTQIYYPL